MTTSSSMRDEVSEYCAKIGADPLLVQGAGGNVSWKDGSTLWVKASGMWLADAIKQDIFVPVDLDHMIAAVDQLEFAAAPQTIGDAILRPSIETMLHALMPHPVVVHLHPVELLAWLVREDAAQQISSHFANVSNCGLVKYAKPGEQLARAVHGALVTPDINILFLLNHGVVIGGDDVAQIHAHLAELLRLFKSAPKPIINPLMPACFTLLEDLYLPIPDIGIQQLALDSNIYSALARHWAICPDHVVFLGAAPKLYSNRTELPTSGAQSEGEIVFIEADGVFSRGELSRAKLLQLRCYYDVMCRLPTDSKASTLSAQQIAELLNWDAERYRTSIAK